MFGKPKWAKLGFLGFPKSGKTYTAITIACALHRLTESTRPVVVYDSEGGFDYQVDRIRELTGLDPAGVQSQSFVDLVNLTKTCVGGDIVIIDSVTHPWRELLEAKQSRMGRFRGIMSAKEDWTNQFTSWYLTSPCHVIICGRAGFIFAEEEDSKEGMKLTTKGTKMKTESELGFEPSLLIEMERVEQRDGTLSRVAIVKGDRFGVIDGRRFTNPGFDDFKPFFDRLDFATGGPPSLDVSAKTVASLDDDGRSRLQEYMQERDIVIEEIENDFRLAVPGQGAADKARKIELLRRIWGTSSWTALQKEVSKYTLERLREGRKELLVEFGMSADQADQSKDSALPSVEEPIAKKKEQDPSPQPPPPNPSTIDELRVRIKDAYAKLNKERQRAIRDQFGIIGINKINGWDKESDLNDLWLEIESSEDVE